MHAAHRHVASAPHAVAEDEREPQSFHTQSEAREIAGYRVVRRLAVGARSAVYLGHPVGIRGGRSVVLRVFHREADSVGIDREIAALLAAPHGVAALVHDVVTLPDGRLCVVQDRDDGTRLSDLLHSRGSLRAGEAVTILAPIVAGLDQLHDVGWVHGNVAEGSVRFDPTGRPRLGRWFAAQVIGSGMERTQLLRDEYTQLAHLVTTVCAVIDRHSVAAHELETVHEWLSERVSAHPFVPVAAELEQRLFRLGRALPVRFAQQMQGDGEVEPNGEPFTMAQSIAHPTLIPARRGELGESLRNSHTGAAHESAHESRDEPDQLPTPVWHKSVFGDVLGAAVVDAVDGVRLNGWLSERRRGMSAVISRHRRPLLVGGCIGAATLVLAITLIPPQSIDGDVSDTGAIGERETSDTEFSADGARRSSPDDGESTETVESVPANAVTPVAESSQLAILGPDPVAAAVVLLGLRDECFRTSSILCLDQLAATDSPLSRSDAASIRRAQESGIAELPLSYDVESIALVEQSGGAAVLAISPSGVIATEEQTKPASLLMIRGEAGWRLREIFDY